MTEHPLTDLDAIGLMSRGLPDATEKDNMRAAADWQLEKVIEWLNETTYERGSSLEAANIPEELREAMRPEKDGFVVGRNYLANRVAELEKALNELMDVCAECDSWESFPSRPLDKAHSVLNK